MAKKRKYVKSGKYTNGKKSAKMQVKVLGIGDLTLKDIWHIAEIYRYDPEEIIGVLKNVATYIKSKKH